MLNFKKKEPKNKLNFKKPSAKAKAKAKAKANVKEVIPVNMDNKTYVMIDASYFIFRRYCATQVWFCSHTSKGEKDDCNINNSDFTGFFTKHFNDWVGNIIKQYKPDQIFWFKDSPKATVWRTPLFEQYKEHRDDLCPPHVGEFFKYAYQSLIPPDRVIVVPTAEADDALAISARYEHANNPNLNIIVFTGDTDYLQLVNDKIKVVNMKGKKCIPLPVQVVTGVVDKKKVKQNVDGATYLFIKILLGDKTDGIPGIKGVGPATAWKLSQDPEYFNEFIMNNPKRRETFEHNQLMISFDYIPQQLQDDIRETYVDVKEGLA